jgi:predicted HicB family RNase H-like nuclease
MNHLGFVATLETDKETGVISGVVANARATLHFQGNAVEEAQAAFVDTVEDYRAWFASEGREPTHLIEMPDFI